MYIRQRDVLVGAVLVLYIVFFALSPPDAVRRVLSHPIGVAASFGVAVYTALYYSRPIGALLIVALLASMTKVTEHLTDGERTTLQTELTSVNSTISQLQGMGLSPDTNDALKRAMDRRTAIQSQLSAPTTPPLSSSSTPPITTPTAPAPSSPAPAAPPTAPPTAPTTSSTAPPSAPPTAPTTSSTAPPAPVKPVMACNIENFAPF